MIMSNAINDNNNSYGRLHLNLTTLLYKAGRSHEILFNLYIATKVHIAEWKYCETDIQYNTGLHHRTVKKVSAMYVSAGIFQPIGTTRNGSPKYKLNEEKFETYMAGETPLPVVLNTSKCLTTESSPGTNGATLNEKPGSTVSATLDSHNTGQPGVAPGCHPGVAPTVLTNNKEDNKEENKEHIRTEESAYVSISTNPRDDKAQQFIKAVTDLQADVPEYGIIITKKTKILIQQYFADNPDKDANGLFTEYQSAVDFGTLNKFIVYKEPVLGALKPYDHLANGEYDDQFWFKRSVDVSFFIKNHANIISKLEGLNK